MTGNFFIDTPHVSLKKNCFPTCYYLAYRTEPALKAVANSKIKSTHKKIKDLSPLRIILKNTMDDINTIPKKRVPTTC